MRTAWVGQNPGFGTFASHHKSRTWDFCKLAALHFAEVEHKLHLVGTPNRCGIDPSKLVFLLLAQAPEMSTNSLRIVWPGGLRGVAAFKLGRKVKVSELAGLGGKTCLHSVRVFCAHLDPPNAHMG